MVLSCVKCQRNNFKLTKASGEIHPIPVKAELWNQVGMNLITPLSKYRVVIGISLLLQSIFESGLRQVLFLIKQRLE